MISDTFIKMLIPFAAIFSSLVTYIFTRKGKVDDLTIKRGIEIAEKLSVTVQNIMEDEEYFYQLYDGNYGHADDMDKAIRNFKLKESLFGEDYEKIEELAKSRKQVNDDLKVGRLYLNGKIIEDIQTYINIGHFSFQQDGSGLIDTYYLNFFKNLIDENNRQKRSQLSESIKKGLKKLLK